MKFTVNIHGADNGLIQRLTVAANRKLAPALRRLAAHHARHVSHMQHANGDHYTAPSSTSTTSHRHSQHSPMLHPVGASRSQILSGVVRGSAYAAGSQTLTDRDVTVLGGATDDAAPGGSDISASTSSDAVAVFDVAIDPELL